MYRFQFCICDFFALNYLVVVKNKNCIFENECRWTLMQGEKFVHKLMACWNFFNSMLNKERLILNKA